MKSSSHLSPSLRSPNIFQSICVDEEISLDLSNPKENGKWLFVKSDGVIQGNKKMSVITMSISVPDPRDLFSEHYDIRISADGSTIFAKTPFLSKYQVEDYKMIFRETDAATKLGYSTFARNYQSYTLEERTYVTAYKLKDFTLTTEYFNGKLSAQSGATPALGRDGTFVGRLRTTTYQSSIQPNNHQVIPYMFTTAYAMFAIRESVEETQPEVENAFASEFACGLQLSKPS